MKVNPLFWVIGLTLFFVNVAQAGITLGGTRLVYNETKKEVSILVKNDGLEDIMIQSWVESNDKRRADDVPFALTPSLSRLATGKQQFLRIFYLGKGLALDKESVFWLNVQEIPQKAKSDNTLQIALRQRIKVFYRPAALAGTPEDSIKSLVWQWVKDNGKYYIKVNNPSSYHVSFGAAYIDIGGKHYPVTTKMVEPGAMAAFPVSGAPSIDRAEGSIVFSTINDFGAPIENTASLAQ